MVVEGACLLVVLVGRLGRRGTGLVGVMNEVPAAVEHEVDPPAVQCESQAPSDLLEGDGLARPVVDVEELQMPIGELRGDQVGDELLLSSETPYTKKNLVYTMARVGRSVLGSTRRRPVVGFSYFATRVSINGGLIQERAR